MNVVRGPLALNIIYSMKSEEQTIVAVSRSSQLSQRPRPYLFQHSRSIASRNDLLFSSKKEKLKGFLTILLLESIYGGHLESSAFPKQKSLSHGYH